MEYAIDIPERPNSNNTELYHKLLTYDDLYFYCDDLEKYCDFLESKLLKLQSNGEIYEQQ